MHSVRKNKPLLYEGNLMRKPMSNYEEKQTLLTTPTITILGPTLLDVSMKI